jgi:hypothetical protein
MVFFTSLPACAVGAKGSLLEEKGKSTSTLAKETEKREPQKM